ncbi:MAG TPA: C40 family peptidase [Steroidobacteraceae bacterium]|nr:C40 family peptidase [Steroidobacteraceae bacterium]
MSQQLVVQSAIAALVLLLVACAGEPHRPSLPVRRTAVASPQATAVLDQVASLARRMIGSPYRFGGRTPAGFDCSGLVYYAYEKAGVTVPRTAAEQRRASRALDRDEAEPGDLVFFKNDAHDPHVGIYLGGEWFVHAPSTGRPVSIEKLHDDYYRRHLVTLARLEAVMR